MDGWGFASFKVIIGFHREGRKGGHAASQPTLAFMQKLPVGLGYLHSLSWKL